MRRAPNKISCFEKSRFGIESKNFPPPVSYRTFNPADYAEPAGADESYGNSTNNTWNNSGSFEPDDGTSKWLGVQRRRGFCGRPVALRRFRAGFLGLFLWISLFL